MARSAGRVERQTVELGGFPDLIVIYLGMQVRSVRGMAVFMKLGKQIKDSVAAKPDGLLLHENVLFSLVPMHAGMRQYWRDFESMESWTRELPHGGWWRDFLKDSKDTGFWHETYSIRGGMEAVYDDIKRPTGFMNFAPVIPARGPLFTSRSRLALEGEGPPPMVPEAVD